MIYTVFVCVFFAGRLFPWFLPLQSEGPSLGLAGDLARLDETAALPPHLMEQAGLPELVSRWQNGGDVFG